MDPMEYTMDDNPLPNPSPQCQPHQPHQHSGTSNFASAAREAHHYDPVHNTELWLLPAGGPTYLQPQPPYAAPQNVPSWASRHYTPLQSWPVSGASSAGLYTPDRLGTTGAYIGVPGSLWAQGRDDLGIPPNYFHSPYWAGGVGGSSEPIMPRPPSHVSSTSPPSAHVLPSAPQLYPFTPYQPGLTPGASRYPLVPPTPSSNPERTTVSDPRLRYTQRDRQASEGEPEQRALRHRTGGPPPVRLAHTARAPALPESLNRRRRTAPTWDSDDDDDSTADMEIDALRRGAEASSAADFMDERSLAFMRAQMASCKKIPSKEALMALEDVEVKDLKESEQACIICYNELGAVNPDGIMEKPIRLPQCKHIFGEKCIRKWFEENDTCPYCRNKLPSHASSRKSAAVENLRAYRASMMRGSDATRARGSYGVRFPGTDDLTSGPPTYRNPYDVSHVVHHHFLADHTWATSSPSRPPGSESPENRRRQARGRVGPNRTASLSNRPPSVGSSRFLAPNTTSALSAQHPPPHGLQSGSSNPSLPSLSPVSSINAHDMAYLNPIFSTPQNRPASNTQRSPEEASPPVAVGSMATDRGTQTTQHPQRPSTDHLFGHYMDLSNAYPYRGPLGEFSYGRPLPHTRTPNGDNAFDPNSRSTSRPYQNANGENMDASPARSPDANTPQHSPRSFDYSTSPTAPIPRWTT